MRDVFRVQHAVDDMVGKVHVLGDPTMRLATETVVMPIGIKLTARCLVFVERTIDLLTCVALDSAGVAGEAVTRFVFAFRWCGERRDALPRRGVIRIIREFRGFWCCLLLLDG